MGLYNVVAPCVVGNLHYARPKAEPIEVDDDVAAPLVEAGGLVPYAPGGYSAPVLGFDASLPAVGFEESTPDDEPPTNPAPPRTRGGRRAKD